MSLRTIHYIYWALIFFQGIFELLNLSSALYKVGIPLLSTAFFAHAVINSKIIKKELKLPYLNIVVIFIIVSLVSALYNGIASFSFFYFIIYSLNSYLYFLVIINGCNKKTRQSICKCISFLFLLQIPAMIIKFVIIGQSEKGGIGTLSLTSGSVSTTVPMLVTAILFSYYLYTSQKKYVILIIPAVLFGIIGMKRAVIFFIPLTMVMVYVLYLIQSKAKLISPTVIKRMFFLFLAGIVLFVFSAKTNPTLNPNNSKWGRFDFDYVLNYSKTYTSSEQLSHEEMRRKDGLIFFAKKVINSGPINMILGDGAGKLVQSKYNRNSGTMLDLYGVRYGGRMGFIWLLLQTGILGTFLYILFIYKTFRFVWKFYKQDPLYLAYLALTFVFLIDFAIYSATFLRFEFLKGVYFLIFGLIYLDVHSCKLKKRGHPSFTISAVKPMPLGLGNKAETIQAQPLRVEL